MKRLFVALFVLLGLLAATLCAADFWEKKKFQEWDQKDLQKMLTNSPWARPVEIAVGSPAGGGGGGRGRRGGGGGGGPMSAESGSPGGGGISESGGGGMGGSGGGIGPPPTPTMKLIVRWHSSLPVRQAVARARFGDEVGNSPEAAKTLNREEARYVIGVAGLPQQMMRIPPEKLRETVALKIKDKSEIRPFDIKASASEGKVDLYVFFYKGQEGSPVIALEDGETEFAMKIGPLEVKRKFKLKEMVYEGKLEL